MKYAIVIPDGAADRPLDALGGKTPLEAADKPVIDSLAAAGRVGLAHNVPDGYEPGSDVAILSLLGYDVTDSYTGRAPIEAAAQGIEVADDEWVFRANLVTLADGVMEDYCSGHITTEEGTALIDAVNAELGGASVRFHHGVSYRHLAMLTGDFDVTTTPPHNITGRCFAEHLPRGAGAEQLVELIDASRAILADHPVNVARRREGKRPATSIWFWGEGKMPTLPSFAERFGLSAGVITAVDLLRGIAELTGMERIDVPGATGFVDTDYAGKGAAAASALDRHDIVIVHVEAPDECGHNNMAIEKVQAIADIDRLVVPPLLARLRQSDDGWRIVVSPDHPTPCELKTHTSDPVPFVLAGDRIAADAATTLTERAAADGGLVVKPGYELMKLLLG